MIIEIDVYIKEFELKTLDLVEKDSVVWINPSHVVSMNKEELSMILSSNHKYYLHHEASWEYVRKMVYMY